MADQIIVALSGRKGAGKNTIGSFIGQHYTQTYWPSEEYGFPSVLQAIREGLLECQNDAVLKHLTSKAVFECSFADSLKEFCINVLGLSRESCYGTDEQKNAPTDYNWETAPRFLQWKFSDTFAKEMVAAGKTQDQLMDLFHRRLSDSTLGMTYANGKMSGREIMQIFGTDLIRQTFGNVWAEATVRMITREGKPLSIITDNRFPNEIETILKQPNGYVIRLTRSPFGHEDTHPSESALDHYDWNRPKCFVLDNANMTIEEQNEAVKPVLSEILGVN